MKKKSSLKNKQNGQFNRFKLVSEKKSISYLQKPIFIYIKKEIRNERPYFYKIKLNSRAIERKVLFFHF